MVNPKNTFPSFIKTVLIVYLQISLLLAACSLPYKETPTDSPSPEAKLADIALAEQQYPPDLVETIPINGSLIGLEDSLTFYFNQAMDKHSVEASFQAEPAISGQFRWQDEASLTFIPDQPLPPDSLINLTLTENAKAANGKALLKPIQLYYQVTSHLLLTSSLPYDQADEVDPSSAIVAAFNQPVVALGIEDPPMPFSIQPTTEGKGEWINTSTYVFNASQGLQGGTDYQVTLNPGLKSIANAPLDAEQATSWRFTTTLPEVLYVSPEKGPLGLEAEITVKFNIRMDRASTEQAFQLRNAGNKLVDGIFAWDESQTELSFTASEPLQRNSNYSLILDQSASSLGGIPLRVDFRQDFTTYPEFGLAQAFTPKFEDFGFNFGEYELQFSSPVDKKSYLKAVNVTPKPPSLSTYLYDENLSLVVNAYFEPATDYTVTIDKRLQDIWGGQLGEDLVLRFRTPNADASFSINVGLYGNGAGLAFLPSGESEIFGQATNISYLNISTAPISLDTFKWFHDPDNYDGAQNFYTDNLYSYTQYLNLPANKSTVVPLPMKYNEQPLTPGIYFVRIDVPQSQVTYRNTHAFVLIVSQFNTVMKTSQEQIFIWVSRLADQSALVGAPITVFTSDGETVLEGETDHIGFYSGANKREGDIFYPYFALIGDPSDPDTFSMASTIGNSGQIYWDSGFDVDFYPGNSKVYTYTDRPIYQPGQTVFFKSIIRALSNGQYSLPAQKAYQVEVHGSSTYGVDQQIYSERLTLNAYGSLTGAVELPEGAFPGSYRIQIKDNDLYLDTYYFEVANYRKPELDLELSLNQTDLRFGDNLAAEVRADYYFGMPGANLAVDWVLYARRAYFPLPGFQSGPLNTSWMQPRYYPWEGSALGQTVLTGTGTTDQDGRLNLTFAGEDIMAAGLKEQTILTLEVTLKDANGLPLSQRATATLHPESFYIGIQTKQIVGRAGEETEFLIKTVDWQQGAFGQVLLEAAFSQVNWELSDVGDALMGPQYEAVETVISTASPVTNSNGEVRLAFTPPEAGTYQLTLKSGNAVSQVLLWVSGESAAMWPELADNKIELIADATEYQPGQIANVFIPNPFEGQVYGLVTLERESVLRSEVIKLSGAGTNYAIAIDEDLLPNVYLSVLIIGKDQTGKFAYRQGMLNLPVNPLKQLLKLSVSIDPQVALPGQDISALLTATDYLGEPVQGEFSIAAVDKAIFALMPPSEQPIQEAFYGNRPISVLNGFSMAGYTNMIAPEPLGIGGGGGDGLIGTQLRKNFQDTAYWEAFVVTGADGKGQFKFKLPDNLTTWQVLARGINRSDQVGEVSVEILTQKSLMIIPKTPRFLVSGDRVKIGAEVFNNTEAALSTEVNLAAKGLRLEQETNQVQAVQIPAKGSISVHWWGMVEDAEEVDLVFSASAGAYKDATTPEAGLIPVLKYLAPLRFTSAGVLDKTGTTLEVVSLPRSFEAQGGALTLSLTTSLSEVILQGLQAIKIEEQEDTYSLTAAILSNLVAYSNFESMGELTPELKRELESQITLAVNRLQANQSYDGGWQWFTPADRSEESSLIATGYALLSLTRAEEAGFEVNEYIMTAGQDFLQANQKTPDNQSDSQAWQLQAFLTYINRKNKPVTEDLLKDLFQVRSQLTPWAKAFLALSLNEKDPRDKRVRTLISDLESSAIRSATGAFWESEAIWWSMPGTPAFTTAVVMCALADIKPASPLLIDGLRYLVSLPQAGQRWGSAFDHAWILIAIDETIQGTGDLRAYFNFSSTLNNKPIAQGSASTQTTNKPIQTSIPISDLETTGTNLLAITRDEGPERLYYRGDLVVYQPAEQAQAINKGLTIERQYELTSGCQENCKGIHAVTLTGQQVPPLVRATLTLTIPHDVYNLQVLDYIPAGAEILNPKLMTSQWGTPVESINYDDWHWWFFDPAQIYDERIEWHADFLPAGTYTLNYLFYPIQAGQFQVLPAQARLLFFPEVEGSSPGALFEIIED